MHLRIVAASALLLMSSVSANAAPIEAIRAGDMQQMIEEIIGVYEGAGLSWDYGIEWKPGPFTTTYWYYDPNEGEIVTGVVPRDDQVDVYWQAWSNVLTDGNFEPGSFFASVSEARELARYNQYVLATHESAHAITFRYDSGHLQRHDYAVNCREYYADRLTIAILNDQARLDPDMKRWRARYLELVAAMGDTIPEKYRYHVADFATLDANCATIDVAQPTPETMQPYASAYFERYRVLLEADLPPLAEVFDAHLVRYQREALAALPLDPERASLELVTLDPLIEPAPTGPDDDPVYRTRAIAFAPDGTLYFAIFGYDAAARKVEIAFGTDPSRNPIVIPLSDWPTPAHGLQISSLAVLSSEAFAIALEYWQYTDKTETASTSYIAWAYAELAADGWGISFIGVEEGMESAAVLRDPGGRLFVMATPDHTSSVSRSTNWRMIEIDAATLAPIAELPLVANLSDPLAIDRDLRLYDAELDELWRNGHDGSASLLVGTELGGNRDGPLARAEIASPEAMQWMADGTALILDSTPGYGDWSLRRLQPLTQ